MAWDFYIYAIPVEDAKTEGITIQILNKQNWEVFEQKRYPELVSYRSKTICFAMQQMVGYYGDGFSWDWDKNFSLFDMQDASILLTLQEVNGILDWLIAVASFLEDGSATEKYANILQNLLPFLDSSEFEHFGSCVYMFQSWQKDVNKHANSLFYWYNSF